MSGEHFQLEVVIETLPDQLGSGGYSADSPGAQICPCQIHAFHRVYEYGRGFNHSRVHSKICKWWPTPLILSNSSGLAHCILWPLNQAKEGSLFTHRCGDIFRIWLLEKCLSRNSDRRKLLASIIRKAPLRLRNKGRRRQGLHIPYHQWLWQWCLLCEPFIPPSEVCLPECLGHWSRT